MLTGLSAVSETVAQWVGARGADAPTIGGFLYGTLAAIGAGILASTVRWLLLDILHHHTGIDPPNWNYARLQKNAAAFEVLKQDHYRFYQFYDTPWSPCRSPPSVFISTTDLRRTGSTWPSCWRASFATSARGTR